MIRDVVTLHFKSASGSPIIPLGYHSVPIKLNDKLIITNPFYIVPHLEEGCILGVDFITQNKLNMIQKLTLCLGWSMNLKNLTRIQ